MAVYLDCNATTPVDPAVLGTVRHYMEEEYGNAGSRTHEFGARAKRAVQRAREQVAAVVRAKPEEVVFTSGATESNNLAILGLAAHGERTGRRHLVTTAIEHKAVLEPMQALAERGFDLTVVAPRSNGEVQPDDVMAAVRPGTLLVSVMHVNNETGVVQPVAEIADRLAGAETYLHVDAAQGFGKELDELRHPGIALISVSGHKVFAPKGIGALVARRRGFQRPPLQPLMFGGGQEGGLRPGTLPVALIAGFGHAAELALAEHAERRAACLRYREDVLRHLMPLAPTIHGAAARTVPHVLNASFPGVDSEALMVALKAWAAMANGSACTSSSYTPSHVLEAMRVEPGVLQGAVRISWCHRTEPLDWEQVARRIADLQL